jgi:hypothetical protein
VLLLLQSSYSTTARSCGEHLNYVKPDAGVGKMGFDFDSSALYPGNRIWEEVSEVQTCIRLDIVQRLATRAQCCCFYFYNDSSALLWPNT